GRSVRVRAFNRRGWDAVAWNCRGCSGEPNRLVRFYHSGSSDDLLAVATHVAGITGHPLLLVGFSLGGNMTLKLMGELGEGAPPWLTGGVAVSVPCDLRASGEVMAQAANRIYMQRFLGDLREKIRTKQARFPGPLLDDTGYEELRSFRDFDNRYTAPLHGFRDAEDYWARCSSRFFHDRIRRPALLLNSEDDPFLAPECFPREVAAHHPWFHLEVTVHGGHVGFVGGGLEPGEYYSERRAIEFARDFCTDPIA
ncbi:MAG TPA: alpha/beta hydrolase, partial [Verrucomicrobiales bacterium]|nr:alpha/beta hydrolase [Verrucomicrobiales bacterium]